MNEVVRTGGRFVKGQSGNPSGRPKQLIIDYQRSLEQLVREHITPAKVCRILNKLVEQAESGDTKAAKLLLDKIIPNAAPDAGDPDSGRTVVFRIENATFAAQQASRVIDAEVVTINPQIDVNIPQESHE